MNIATRVIVGGLLLLVGSMFLQSVVASPSQLPQRYIPVVTPAAQSHHLVDMTPRYRYRPIDRAPVAYYQFRVAKSEYDYRSYPSSIYHSGYGQQFRFRPVSLGNPRYSRNWLPSDRTQLAFTGQSLPFSALTPYNSVGFYPPIARSFGYVPTSRYYPVAYNHSPHRVWGGGQRPRYFPRPQFRPIEREARPTPQFAHIGRPAWRVPPQLHPGNQRVFARADYGVPPVKRRAFQTSPNGMLIQPRFRPITRYSNRVLPRPAHTLPRANQIARSKPTFHPRSTGRSDNHSMLNKQPFMAQFPTRQFIRPNMQFRPDVRLDRRQVYRWQTPVSRHTAPRKGIGIELQRKASPFKFRPERTRLSGNLDDLRTSGRLPRYTTPVSAMKRATDSLPPSIPANLDSWQQPLINTSSSREWPQIGSTPMADNRDH